MSARTLSLKDAQPALRSIAMRVPALPNGLDGLKILFVTDLHYGRWFSSAAMNELTGRIRALAPDLILLGGDLADNLADERGVMAHLKRLTAPLGCVCVPGNNDYEVFGGNYEPFRAMLKDAGVRLLVNERMECPLEGGRLIVSGLDESKYGRPDRAALLFARRTGDFHILLTHSPWALNQVMTPPLPDLVLCGHTHGGQVVLGRLSPYALGYERRAAAKRRFFFVTGDHEVDGARVIVSNGVGFSLLPVRLNAPPEVHLITLDSNVSKGCGGRSR